MPSALSPPQSFVPVWKPGQWCFPDSSLCSPPSPFLTLCHTSPSPYFQEEVYRRAVALLHPIPHLSPPFLHLTVLAMTTHLFYPDPTLVPFPYFLSSSSLSAPHSVLPPPPPLHPPCSLHLSGERSAVLYFAVTLKAAFIRFILRRCGNGMVSLHYTHPPAELVFFFKWEMSNKINPFGQSHRFMEDVIQMLAHLTNT